MTEKQSKELKVEDTVRFSDGVEGRVIGTSLYSVAIDWKDGQAGYIAHEDMAEVSLVKRAAKLSKAQIEYMEKSTEGFIKSLK